MSGNNFAAEQCIEFKLYPEGSGILWVRVHDIIEIKEKSGTKERYSEVIFNGSRVNITGDFLDNTKKIWDLYYDK